MLIKKTAVDFLIEEINKDCHTSAYIPPNTIAEAKKYELKDFIELIIDFQLWMNEHDYISNHLWDYEEMARIYVTQNNKNQNNGNTNF